jgi:hypothetical protein|tara:strand:+ start:3549 stop:4034 length:486 start_codon:yes stop_codon:yes gene_type:complete
MKRYNPDQFFKWLSEPMKREDIQTWNMAHNIMPELTNLFKDYCFSFYYLVRDTYLGDSHQGFNETKIGMTNADKENHYEWCWNKTIENFKKENINFKFSGNDHEFFKEFFFEVFYNQEDEHMRIALNDFLKQMFNRKRPTSKSDLEMFTDVYKTLERALHI